MVDLEHFRLLVVRQQHVGEAPHQYGIGVRYGHCGMGEGGCSVQDLHRHGQRNRIRLSRVRLSGLGYVVVEETG